MSGAQKISAIHTYIRTLGACRCCSGPFDLWSPATRRMNRHYRKIREALNNSAPQRRFVPGHQFLRKFPYFDRNFSIFLLIFALFQENTLVPPSMAALKETVENILINVLIYFILYGINEYEYKFLGGFL
jgi:hypothetical protein